ncbi:hypothetical protein ES703_73840 [subsurface metagenome]
MVNKWGKRTKEGFKRIWSPSQILFAILFGAWSICITIIVTLKVAKVTDISMTYFWIGLYVFAVLALLTLIRIKMEPKDKTTLKEIKERLDLLIEMHNSPKQIDIDKINKEIREYMK